MGSVVPRGQEAVTRILPEIVPALPLALVVFRPSTMLPVSLPTFPSSILLLPFMFASAADRGAHVRAAWGGQGRDLSHCSSQGAQQLGTVSQPFVIVRSS